MTDWTSLNYVVVDIEGNGQQPPDLVELAIVPIEHGKIGEPQSWLVRPTAPITGFARRIHGISNDDVADAPAFAEIEPVIRPLLTDAVFVAHNAPADRSKSSTPCGWLVACVRAKPATGWARWSTPSSSVMIYPPASSRTARPTTPW
jgi:DNA polymerase III epsilon subunit-like protein